MKETIYTIPVSEAFEKDCECPLCELKKRFEDETVQYFVGPSLMEPETRIETNDTGFCARHFEQMYATKANRLGIGLMLDTYMQEQVARLKKAAGGAVSASFTEEEEEPEEKPEKKSLFGRKESAGGNAGRVLRYLAEHEKKCAICRKLDYTMARYTEIILQLFFSEKTFRERIENGKGFCLPHLKLLLETSEKKLSAGKHARFCAAVLQVELRNLDRIEKEVDWFTKKFDYRNQEAPWGNSRDALVRGIRKMTGADNIGD